MFAVIKTGGKQHRVVANEILEIEKLDGEVGDAVTFSEVLMLGGDTPQVGAPLIEGALVTAQIVAQGRGRKIIVFKKRRRQNSRRRNGHRQHFTRVRITGIGGDAASASGASAPSAAAEAMPPAAAEIAGE
jgi:large subunit ribosomal protein L21